MASPTHGWPGTANTTPPGSCSHLQHALDDGSVDRSEVGVSFVEIIAGGREVRVGELGNAGVADRAQHNALRARQDLPRLKCQVPDWTRSQPQDSQLRRRGGAICGHNGAAVDSFTNRLLSSQAKCQCGFAGSVSNGAALPGP